MPGRLLHSLHRRRAQERLRQRPRPGMVLVVCHGNICRSPFAAGLLARALEPGGVRVASAGFVGPDRPCPPAAVTAAARCGVDLSMHRSAVLTAERARAANLIVVMAPAQERAIRERFGLSPGAIVVLGDLDPAPLTRRAIRDPVEQGPAVFAESYTRIARCIDALLATLPTARRQDAPAETLCR